jgi:acyl-coenzyme A thioesterase PaaI-like protein
MHVESLSAEETARLHGAAEISYFTAMSGERLPSKQELIDFLAHEFPQNQCVIEETAEGFATVSHPIGRAQLRPGDTVSGPLLMTVADVAMYVAILATIGLVPLAVTTSLNINFLRRPSARFPITGVCKLLKVGRILVIGEVALYSDRNEEMVAHAVGTYSIPPKR